MLAPAKGPLTGIRVIDITQEVAGPLGPRLLAEMGADVIHLESLEGDNGRNTTTAFLGREGLFHLVCNRSKRGIVVDLRTEEGKEILFRLVKQSDVLVENL